MYHSSLTTNDNPVTMQEQGLMIDAAPIRIRVKNLVKSFRRRGGGGEVIPVNNVSLDVAADEMLVLLGPSGCGKTTLLRCIAGLERPDSGEIFINDEPVYSSEAGIFLPPDKRPISMVFQSYALWPHMTLFDNVAYPLQARNVKSDEIRRRALETLDVVGLADLANQYPGQISGGQQQRVALARAVVPQTGVVLFDEPLSNVDARVREQLRLEIRRMQRAFGFSGLYVTHDQSEAMAVADRIAVLNDGKMEQIGAPEDVYNLPHTSYVGTFIGSANIWSGTIESITGSTITLRTAAGALVIDADSDLMRGAECPNVGAQAKVLARPESMEIHQAPPQGADNVLECMVETRVFLGSHTEYVLTIGTERIKAWIPSISNIAEGSKAWISVASSRLRLIKDSGVTL
jgi:iron(III) transport system ATP-binding protein